MQTDRNTCRHTFWLPYIFLKEVIKLLKSALLTEHLEVHVVVFGILLESRTAPQDDFAKMCA